MERRFKKKSSALSLQRIVILKFNPGHKHEDNIARLLSVTIVYI